jgi:hypothetical protein
VIVGVTEYALLVLFCTVASELLLTDQQRGRRHRSTERMVGGRLNTCHSTKVSYLTSLTLAHHIKNLPSHQNAITGPPALAHTFVASTTACLYTLSERLNYDICKRCTRHCKTESLPEDRRRVLHSMEQNGSHYKSCLLRRSYPC